MSCTCKALFSKNYLNVDILLLLTGFIQIFDPKFKTFSRRIPKLLFPDSRLSNRWSIETLKKKTKKKNAGTKLFPWWQVTFNKIWPTQKKFHLFSACCSLKKIWTFIYVFKTSPLFSRLFPRLENCWANFKTFSRIQDCVETLYLRFKKRISKSKV